MLTRIDKGRLVVASNRLMSVKTADGSVEIPELLALLLHSYIEHLDSLDCTTINIVATRLRGKHRGEIHVVTSDGVIRTLIDFSGLVTKRLARRSYALVVERFSDNSTMFTLMLPL